MKHRDLGVRTLINGLSALFIVFIVFLGLQEPFRIVFALFLALIGAIAVWEYGKLIEKETVVIYRFTYFLRCRLYPCHIFSNPLRPISSILGNCATGSALARLF